MYTRNQEKLESSCDMKDFVDYYNFDNVYTKFVSSLIRPIININYDTNEIEINEDDRYDLLNKLFIIKNDLDYLGISTNNELAIESNNMIIDLITILKLNDLESFKNFVKKLLTY